MRTDELTPTAPLSDTAPLIDAPGFSVIIPVWNGAKTIRDQLDSLVGQTCPVTWEIVVVNNASTDDTAEIVRSYMQAHPHVRLVEAPDQHNLSYVRNVGVRAARADAFAFCDDDDIVGPEWVDAMASALLSHPLVASRMEYERLNAPNSMIGRAHFQSQHIEELFGQPVCNGVIGVQRWVWDRLGGNDQNMSFTGEDFEFALRCHRELGVSPYLAPRAVYHYRLRSGAVLAFRQARAYGRAHVALFRRYGDGDGDRRHANTRALRDLWWIASRAPFAAVGYHRELWGWRAGIRCGRIEGSIRERTWHL